MNIKNNLKKNYLIIVLNLVIISFLMIIGSPHFATNDDLTLNNIATGVYGNDVSQYLVFSNICYGYLIKGMYIIFPNINWYTIFPLIMASIAFVILFCTVHKELSLKKTVIINLIILLFVGKYIFIEFQFTHLAAFFSAVGLFLLYKDFKQTHSIFYLNISGIIFSLLGFMLRFDAFLSVFAIIFVATCIKAFQLKIWKTSIKANIKKSISFIALCLFVTIFLFIDSRLYSKNNEWEYYRTYNTYRSELLDYTVPDYDSYSAEYEKIGIDALDLEMLCSWSYADINKFSLDTMEQIYNLKKIVDKDNFDFLTSLKQGIKDIVKSIDELQLITIAMILFLIAIALNRQNILFIPVFIITILELLYLSFKGRFIFRSYFGIWMIFIFIAIDLFLENVKEYKLTNINFFYGVLCIGVLWTPMVFDIWQKHYETKDVFYIQDQNDNWMPELLEKKEYLYVNETYFGDMPGTRDLFSMRKSLQNIYTLGGWTCPAPLEQNMLQRYDIENNGLYRALYDDSKNVFYFDSIGSNSVEKQLNYLRKEYNENIQYEIIDKIENIFVYRFFVDEKCNIDQSTTKNIGFTLNNTYVNNSSLYLEGYIDGASSNYDKCNVWIEANNIDTGSKKYYRMQNILPEDLKEDFFKVGNKYVCNIDLHSIEKGEINFKIIIEKATKTYVSPDIYYTLINGNIKN